MSNPVQEIHLYLDWLAVLTSIPELEAWSPSGLWFHFGLVHVHLYLIKLMTGNWGFNLLVTVTGTLGKISLLQPPGSLVHSKGGKMDWIHPGNPGTWFTTSLLSPYNTSVLLSGHQAQMNINLCTPWGILIKLYKIFIQESLTHTLCPLLFLEFCVGLLH